LKNRFPVLEALGTTTSPTPFILPERLAQTDAFTQVKEVDGSGPFKFVKDEWQPGHKVVYVKNKDYVPRAEPPNNTSGGKVAKVDRIEWLYIPEPVTAVQALQTGEVDYLENAPNDYAAALARDPDITVRAYPGFIGTVRFNHLYPPFDNVKMRQAVFAVADQRDYLAAMAGDPANWRTCFSVYACEGAETDEDDGGVLSGPRDWNRAKRLVAEAGYQGEYVVLLDPADIPAIARRGPGHRAAPEKARPQCRFNDERMGDDSQTGQRQGTGRQGRLERVRHRLRYVRHGAPAHLVDVAVFCDSDDTHTPVSAISLTSDLSGGDEGRNARAYPKPRR
jgi:peptide/nickel transport system substrate-binding protein